MTVLDQLCVWGGGELTDRVTTSNGAVKHTAACEKSYISGVVRKSTEKPYFQKALLGAVSA